MRRRDLMLWFLVMGLVMAPFVIASCFPKQVCRDKDTYQFEADFAARAVAEETLLLSAAVHDYCSCRANADGDILWVGNNREWCEKAATTVQTLKVRMPWHHSMQLYVAGLIEEEPSEEPPKIPPATDLCKAVAPHDPEPDDEGDDDDSASAPEIPLEEL